MNKRKRPGQQDPGLFFGAIAGDSLEFLFFEK